MIFLPLLSIECQSERKSDRVSHPGDSSTDSSQETHQAKKYRDRVTTYVEQLGTIRFGIFEYRQYSN
jgi:hypothetical protein